MPNYDFECTDCSEVVEKRMSFADYDEFKASNPKCESCGKGTLERVFLTTPAMSIPGNMTFDGKAKFLGSGQTQAYKDTEARVPINIIDEMPDGTTKVTRIGRKQDIENE